MPDRNSESHKTELVRHLPGDLSSSEAVRALLSDPLSTTTALITGALASGREDIVLAGGRLVQAVLKGRAFKQLGRELDDLLKKGKIRKDYADTKYGFQSLVDLVTMIDSDAPDDDKLRAAKAMFVAVNSPNASEGEAFLRYQLFRLVLKLSGSQLVLLSICGKLRKERVFNNETTARTAQNWLNFVANRIGHQVFTLIEQDETALIQYRMISDRSSDRSGIDPKDGRLTDLGVKVCELIDSYDGDIPKSDAQKR